MSALRARCPDCRTLTAVAIGPEYQCHSCGREFAAGLLRVARGCAVHGGDLAAGATMELPWPEAATIAEATLDEQIEATARELPLRPIVLGGCACAHLGAVQELARRHGRLGIIAHGLPDAVCGSLAVFGDVTGLGEPGQLPAAVYMALDGDLADPGALEPLFAALPRPAGAGFTGLRPSADTEAALARLGHALGL